MFENRTIFYILDKDMTPLPCFNFHTYVKFMKDLGDNTQIAKNELKDTKNQSVFISTVFLGIDHSFMGGGDPILWETMIFGGDHDQLQERYTSYADALGGHQFYVDLITGKLPLEQEFKKWAGNNS